MKNTVADYPSHRELFGYFSDFADNFGLRDGFSFGTEVEQRSTPVDGRLGGHQQRSRRSVRRGTRGCSLANGTLSEPKVPTFAGHVRRRP